MATEGLGFRNKTWQFLTAVYLLVAVSAPTLADDGAGTKTPLQIESEEAQYRATIAESLFKEKKAKKDIAELNDLTSDYTLPATDVTTKDNAGYYGELLSFVALEKSATEFVNSMSEDQVGRVVISSDFNMTNVAALWNLTDKKFKAFEADFPNLFAEPFDIKDQTKMAGFFVGALAALGSAAQLAGFFKVKQEFSGRSITPSSEALKSQVVKHLKLRCFAAKKNTDPDICFEPVLPEFIVKIDPALVKRMEDLEGAKISASDRRLAEIDRAQKSYNIDLTKIDTELKTVEDALKNDPSNVTLKTQLHNLTALKPLWSENEVAYKKVTKEFNSFIERLESVPEGATQSALEQLFLYSSVIVDDQTKILVAKTISQGADMETSSGALRRTKISFVGGSVAVFFLSDLSGNILQTDVIPVVALKSFNTRISTDSQKTTDFPKRVQMELENK